MKNTDIETLSEHSDAVFGSISSSESDAQNTRTKPVEEDLDADIIEYASAAVRTKRTAPTTVSD